MRQTRRPAVLIHVAHLVGIGHLMRARLIAKALADAGVDVHLVSGGMPIDRPPPSGVRVVQLPPVRVTEGDFSILRDAQGQPIDDAVRRARRDLLLATFDAVAPAAVIVETFPFGRRALSFELVPLLERIETTPRRPVVIASVRDILQQRRKPEREREMVEAATRWFDAILVHGDSRFARIDDTFARAPELGLPIHYTGFVTTPKALPPAHEAQARSEIVVSAGGGAVGNDLLAAALAARARSRFGHLTWRFLVGPNVAAADFEHLERSAGPRAIVERAREDFAALLGQALVSVSQAGYNTVLDVMAERRARRDRPLCRARGNRATHACGAPARAWLRPRRRAGRRDAGASRRRNRCGRIAGLVAALGIRLRRGRLLGTSRVRIDRARRHRGHFRRCGTARSARSAAVTPWDGLARELDAWADTGRCASLWLRDDDACGDSPKLRRLLGIAGDIEVPVALAAIPAALEPSLVDVVAESRIATVVQHGFAHRSHASAGARNWELGAHRPVPTIAAELREGRAVLARAFGERFAAVLVPPWNRIAPDVVFHLPQAGFHGLSTFGPRVAVRPVAGLTQCNTHVDLIAWRSGRAFVGVDTAIGRFVHHLRARREGEADPAEPTGILTHHLDLDAAGWRFLADLFAHTCEHRAVRWLDVGAAFDNGAVDRAAPAAIFDRSA